MTRCTFKVTSLLFQQMGYLIPAFSIALFFALSPGIAHASVNLPWSTTYSCSDWLTYGALSCDGIDPAGGWTCGPGNNYEQIVSTANNLAGGGGKGQRHWLGDGVNNVSGGTKVAFNSPQTELWIRWYMKFPSGFKWGSPNGLQYFKILYLHNSAGTVGVIPEFFGWNQFNIFANGKNNASSSGGWDTIMSAGGSYGGHKTGDGLWHRYEVHLKISGGIAEYWVDGTKYLSASGVNFGLSSFASMQIGSNDSSPANGSCMPVDFDDVAINNTGYIGPVGESTPPSFAIAPSPPIGLMVQ